jgi:hypothetical protein
VLTDILLGVGMRGTDLAQAVRERQPGLPVLLMRAIRADCWTNPEAGNCCARLIRAPNWSVPWRRSWTRLSEPRQPPSAPSRAG